jgi:hypothetical protein
MAGGRPARKQDEDMTPHPNTVRVAAIAALLLSFGCLAGTLALFILAEMTQPVIAAEPHPA